MTRFLLDTNIVSNITKPQPSRPLLEWMMEQEDDSLCIASLTLAEIRRGILAKPDGRKRRELELWFAGPTGPEALFAGRVLPFDAAAALLWADLMATGKAEGRPRSPLDMMIAATARAHECLLVTDNERDFWGVEIFNPMKDFSTPVDVR